MILINFFQDLACFSYIFLCFGGLPSCHTSPTWISSAIWGWSLAQSCPCRRQILQSSWWLSQQIIYNYNNYNNTNNNINNNIYIILIIIILCSCSCSSSSSSWSSSSCSFSPSSSSSSSSLWWWWWWWWRPWWRWKRGYDHLTHSASIQFESNPCWKGQQRSSPTSNGYKWI